MGLETPTYLSDLVATNPVSGDPKGQGDDHIRNLKTALQNTFPNASKAFRFPSTTAKTANFTIVSTEMHTTFIVDTTSGSVTATLPSLAVGDAGWQCSFIKTNTGTNPLFIAPASGTIQSGEVSGLTKCRRCIPGHRTTVLWTGTAWYAERVVREPVGSCIEFHGTALPVGYEWPNGQTLSSSSNYPEYNSVRGGLTTADRRGRVCAGKDDMGGSSADRLTNQSGGLNGDTFEATGGSETHVITQAQLPNVSLTTTIAAGQGSHTHTHTAITSGGHSLAAGGFSAPNATAATINSATLPEMTGSTPTGGSGTAHNNVQPTIVENLILVVE